MAGPFLVSQEPPPRRNAAVRFLLALFGCVRGLTALAVGLLTGLWGLTFLSSDRMLDAPYWEYALVLLGVHLIGGAFVGLLLPRWWGAALIGAWGALVTGGLELIAPDAGPFPVLELVTVPVTVLGGAFLASRFIRRLLGHL